jgi:hypothetical protein
MERQVRLLSLLAGVCVSIFIPFTQAGDFEFRADLSYSEANPDYSAFDNGEGVTWYGRVTYAQSVFAFVRRSDASFQPSGMVSGAEIDHWLETGLGYHLPISEQWAMEAIVSHQKIEQVGGNKESGKGYQLGARYRPVESIGFGLDVGKVDVKIDDWTLAFEVDYQLSDHVYFVGRLRDYADWDFTYYEGGFGVRF